MALERIHGGFHGEDRERACSHRKVMAALQAVLCFFENHPVIGAPVEVLARVREGLQTETLQKVKESRVLHSYMDPLSFRQYNTLVSASSAGFGVVIGVCGLVLGSFYSICFCVGGMFLFSQLVDRALLRLADKKRETYERDLAGMMNMIVLGVEAGATFDTAFGSYVDSFDAPLALASRKTYRSYISGVRSRSDALDELAKEIDSEIFFRFIATIKRALYLGSPLSLALDDQLSDIRAYRKEKVEEEIAKKPVKILLPLGVCILPAMLILLLGPILMEVMQGINMGA
ncbi:MAG: type II secretion system F family protein [Coriobacteriia bacterium]|nr:type II secretion system F family protein [Coriobacteriia bacterium]